MDDPHFFPAGEAPSGQCKLPKVLSFTIGYKKMQQPLV